MPDGRDMPKRAVVLAAGFGSRLRPLTWSCPKPLVPLWGVPLVEHILRMLRRWGVEEACVNLHQGAELVQASLRAMTDVPRLVFSAEREILGTGGALRPIRDWLGNEPFWMVNADIACDLDPGPLVDALTEDVRAVLWVTSERGPRTVDVADGCVASLRSAAPGGAGTATFCGLQLLRPEIVGDLPATSFCTIVEAYERLLETGGRVPAVELENAFWEDAGTLERCLSLHEETRAAAKDGRPGGILYRAVSDVSRGGGFVCTGEGTVVAADAEVERCVLGRGVTIAPGASVSGAMVADGVALSGSVEGLVARAEDVDEPWVDAVARAIGEELHACHLQGLGTRGSDRSFWRLRGALRSAIVTAWSTVRPENDRYAGHARLLSNAGVKVPEVICEPCRRTLALQDLGGVSLESRMNRDRRRALGHYTDLLRSVVRLHDTGTRRVAAEATELEPAFDAALYRWERELFAEQLLGPVLGLSGEEMAPVLAELEIVAARLLEEPCVLVHRDLQSSNVLLHGGDAWLIDFQGMRMGAAVYDLASLLCDPYVMLEPCERDTLLHLYESERGVRIQKAAFAAGAVQRLAQALGAFGRLSRIPGMERFRGYIAPAGRMMEEMLGALDPAECHALTCVSRKVAQFS